MQSLVNSHVYSKLAQCCQGEISTVLHSIVKPFANKTTNKYILLLLPKGLSYHFIDEVYFFQLWLLPRSGKMKMPLNPPCNINSWEVPVY